MKNKKYLYIFLIMIPMTSAKYSFRLCVLPHIWEEHSIRTKQPVHTPSNLPTCGMEPAPAFLT